MNLAVWKKMFHSSDMAVCQRTSDNARVINKYLSYPLYKDVTDEKLMEELKSFNEFAAAKTGETVFDVDKKPLDTGIREVDDYLLNLGLSR